MKQQLVYYVIIVIKGEKAKISLFKTLLGDKQNSVQANTAFFFITIFSNNHLDRKPSSFHIPKKNIKIISFIEESVNMATCLFPISRIRHRQFVMRIDTRDQKEFLSLHICNLHSYPTVSRIWNCSVRVQRRSDANMFGTTKS